MDKGSHKGSGSHAVFYKPVAGVEEVRTGYLIKSPPSGPFRSLKSWKRRFFVLFKMSEDKHQLKYFKSAEDREKPLGGIDLSRISLLFASPQKHHKWPWINKNFRCSPECVLYVRVSDRDYFLIGENSSELDDWFGELYEALKNRPHKSLSPEEMSDERSFSAESISDPTLRIFSVRRADRWEASKGNENEVMSTSETRRVKSVSLTFPCKPQNMKQRSISAPTPVPPGSFMEVGKSVERPMRPRSEPLNPDYDYPRTFLRQHDERYDDEEETDEEDTNSYYVKMETVYETVRAAEQRDEDLHVQSLNAEAEQGPGGSLMKSVTQVFEKHKIQMSLSSLEEDIYLLEGEDFPSKCSSASNENGVSCPVTWDKPQPLEEQSSTESSNDEVNPEEKDIHVNRSDLKKYLTLADMEGRPCVFGWTAQQTTCLFHKGDQVLAINDLYTSSVEEFQNYLCRLLKNQVKLTVLRLPGSKPLHSALHSCE